MQASTFLEQSSAVAAVLDHWGSDDIATQLTKRDGIDRYTKDNAPLAIFHGTADRLVPYKNALELDAGYKRTGVAHQLFPLLEQAHGCWNALTEQNQTQDEAGYSFLARVMQLGKGPAASFKSDDETMTDFAALTHVDDCTTDCCGSRDTCKTTCSSYSECGDVYYCCGAPGCIGEYACPSNGGLKDCACNKGPGDSGGALIMLTQSFTDVMLNTFIPLVDKAVATLSIPDQDLGEQYEFNINVKNIKIASLDLTGATIAFKESQGLALSIPFEADISADFEAKFAHWPHKPDSTGTVTANANSGSTLSALVTIGADNWGRPKVDLDNPQCSLSLGVSIHGSDYDWLLDLLRDYFTSSISGAICSGALSGMQGVMDNTVSPFLSALNMQIDLSGAVPAQLQTPTFKPAFDLALGGAPVITDSSIALAVRAEVFNSLHRTSMADPPKLPTFAAGATHMLSAEVASWAFDHALALFHAAGVLHYTVTADEIPAACPIQLRTNSTSWRLSAPGLHSMCGNCLMDMVVDATAAPTMSLDNGTAKIVAPASFAFVVIQANGTREPAFTLACPLTTAANITMGDGTADFGAIVHASFRFLNCHLSLVNTSAGAVHVEVLGAAINFISDQLLVPYGNQLLVNGFTLPQFEDLTLHGAEVVLDEATLFIDGNLEYHTADVLGFREERQLQKNML